MTRLRLASVIITLCLLACTATASAECAWVLWYRVTEYRTGGAVEGPYGAEEAYPTLAACQVGLDERLDGWTAVEEKDPDHKTTKRPNYLLVQDKNSLRAQRLHALHCFPDTVDPRVPKNTR
jgi:hypothetical protein